MAILNSIVDGIGGAIGGAINDTVGSIKSSFGNIFNLSNEKRAYYINEDGRPVYKEEIVKFVKDQFEESRKNRLPYELQWRLNIEFTLNGNQYCDINTNLNTIEQIPPMYQWQEREVFNRMLNIFTTRMAKLGRVRPDGIARPASNEPNDIMTAKTCTSIIKGQQINQEMKTKIKTATAWSELIGTSFYKQPWNPKNGRLIGIMNDEDICEGDIDQMAVSPFEIFPDSDFSEGIEGCFSLIHARASHKTNIRSEWGIKVKGREIDVFTLTLDSTGAGGITYNAAVKKTITTKKKDHELILEYYEKPSKQFKNGRFIVVIGNELVYYGEIPFRVGKDKKVGFPFVRQVCIEVPGMFWGKTIYPDLIPVQRAYNAVKNRIHEYINDLVFGVFSIEDDGNMDYESLEEEGMYPGKILPYKRGGQPAKRLENSDLPASVISEEQQLIREFEEISGVSDLSLMSSVPTGAGSGVSLEILTEQDNTRLALPAENITMAVMNVEQQWLRLLKQYVQGPRLLKYVGEDNIAQVISFDQSDLTTDDVYNDSEGEMSQTLGQKRQQTLDFMNAGLFNNPDTGRLDMKMRLKILSMFKYGNLDNAYELENLNTSNAQRENKMIEMGKPIGRPDEYEDFDIHFTEHLKYRLSVDFTRVMQISPQIAQAFIIHIKLTEMAMQYKLQTAMINQYQNQMAIAQQGGTVQQ